MSILFVMIPLALLLLAASIYAFFWAVRTGQFDDLETQGALILFDDEPPQKSGSDPEPHPPTAPANPGSDPDFVFAKRAELPDHVAAVPGPHLAGTR